MTTVDDCQAHLLRVLQEGESLDVSRVDSMTDQLRLDKSLFLGPDNEPSNNVIIKLLPPAIGILKSSTETTEDLDHIIDLIEGLLAPKSFDEVLSFISIEDLVQGLESGISPLQIVCINQIAKAQPPDIVANTPLIDKLLDIFASPSSSCAEPVQNTIIKLASKGQLVVKRIFSESTSNVLFSMHDGGNAILQARLMSLLESILALKWEVPAKLVQFSTDVFDPMSPNWDVLQVLATIQFYRNVVDTQPSRSLLESIEAQLKAIATLFLHRGEHSDVGMFLSTEIFLLFKSLSIHDYELFARLDQELKIVKNVLEAGSREERISLLTFLNPKYLLQYPAAIESVQFKSADITILRNLSTYEPTFQKAGFDQTKLLSLSVTDMLHLLVVIVKTPFGLQKLLSDWPQVMNQLISKEDIRNPEVFNLRREVLEVLSHKPASDLGVWYNGVKQAYGEVVFGPGYGQEAQVAIADETV